MLGQDGHVIQKGSHDSLASTPGLVKHILSQPDMKLQEAAVTSTQEEINVTKLAVGPTQGELGYLARIAGDFSVYSYYLKSIGLKYTEIAAQTDATIGHVPTAVTKGRSRRAPYPLEASINTLWLCGQHAERAI